MGLYAMCPALSPLSEGLPAGPHGHCASVTSSSTRSAGSSALGLLSLSSSSPPSLAAYLPKHWHPFSHLATLSPHPLSSSPQVLLHGVGLLLAALHAPACLRYRFFYASHSPPPFAAFASSCEASRPFGASPPLCAGGA